MSKPLLSYRRIDRLKAIAFDCGFSNEDAKQFGKLSKTATWEALLKTYGIPLQVLDNHAESLDTANNSAPDVTSLGAKKKLRAEECRAKLDKTLRLLTVCTTLGLCRCTVAPTTSLLICMEMLFYPKLGTRSRRALTRRNRQSHRGQKPHTYRPKGTLLKRLARETGMTVEQVYSQLQREREYLLSRDALS